MAQMRTLIVLAILGMFLPFSASAEDPQVQLVCIYNAAGETDYTAEAADADPADVPVAPAHFPVPVGGSMYIGFTSPTDLVAFSVDIAATGDGYSWMRYWQGEMWGSIIPFTDTTNNFTKEGVGEISFTPPADWGPFADEGFDLCGHTSAGYVIVLFVQQEWITPGMAGQIWAP